MDVDDDGDAKEENQKTPDVAPDCAILYSLKCKEITQNINGGEEGMKRNGNPKERPLLGQPWA